MIFTARNIKSAHIEAPNSHILYSYLYQEQFAVILEKVKNFSAARTFFMGIYGHINNSHKMKTVMTFKNKSDGCFEHWILLGDKLSWNSVMMG